MPALGLPRRTPGPSHVRLAMLTLFSLGLGVAFLGILLSRLSLFSQEAGYSLVAAIAGTLLAVLPGQRFSARAFPGRRNRAFLVGCGVVAFGGLLAGQFGSGIWASDGALLLMLGLAAGGCSRLALALLVPMLPARHAASLLGLAGVSFGLGGLAASAVGMATASVALGHSNALWAAIVPALLVVSAIRSGRLRLMRSQEGFRASTGPRRRTTPRTILMALSLVFQAATCAVAACWLAVLLLRGFGVSGTLVSMILTLFWAAVCTGWALARRMPRIREDLLALWLPLTSGVLGGVLLLFGWQPGISLGAMLLGLGVGALFPLTLGLGTWPGALWRCVWVSRALHLSLPASLSVGWAAGTLAFASGPEAFAWTILGCFLISVATILILVADYRLSGDPVLI